MFIFDFADLNDNWKYFLNGKYSKLDIELKGKIKVFFNVNSANYVYMSSYSFISDTVFKTT
ncbi:unnamed protein product, partial [marine sediment metagenome]